MAPITRVEPKAGQESVWDYPRPPRLEEARKRIHILFGGIVLADTVRAKRVLETSHPPVYYIPPEDIQMQYLSLERHGSLCEWKGQAQYYKVTIADKTAAEAAWFYANPSPAFVGIRNYVAFYAGKMDACYVGDEPARPQPGNFYGGWVTDDVVGPFKGEPGTMFW